MKNISNNEINNTNINQSKNDINNSISKIDINKSNNIITTNINNDLSNEINENKTSSSKNDSNNEINTNTININDNINREEINKNKNPGKNEKEEVSEALDKFDQPLEESPLNLSYNTSERKNKKNKLSLSDYKRKRNSVSYLFKGKKLNNTNVNINRNSENDLNIYYNMNRFINPEENKDIQSNNTEIKKRIKNIQENNEINSGDNKSIIINSQNEPKPDLDKKEINVSNNQIEENKNDNINNDNNISKSNNKDNLKDINAINTKEKEASNSNNNNNNENNIKIENNNNIAINKPNIDSNNNIASDSRNYLNQKMNTSHDLSKNYQNDELSNIQNQINKNTTNIFSHSIQNISNINQKNEQQENDDNLPMLLDKIQDKINEKDINDNININNNGEYHYVKLEENGNAEQNGFDISNGRKFSDVNNNMINNNNDTLNGKINIIFSDNDNNMNVIVVDNNQGVKGENNIARSEGDKEMITTESKNKEKRKTLEEGKKSNNRNNISKKELDENQIRMSTEEFLENNLEEEDREFFYPHKNNEFEKNNIDIKEENSKEIINDEKDKYNNKNNTQSQNKDKNSEISEDEHYSKEISLDEYNNSNNQRVVMRQIIPVSYICKIRQKEFVINKLIPKKKRVFISKTPGNKKEKGIIIPEISLCLMTNQYIIPKKQQIFTPITNNYFFQTKLTNYKLHKKNSFMSKLPTVYKKIIVSPGKKSLFCIKHRNNKFESIINISDKGNTIDIDVHKAKNKKEKISLISKDKDKDTDEYTSSQNENKNKERNLIIKKNNRVIKQLMKDVSGNGFDISIQFSNQTPNGMMNIRNIRRFPVSANKKRKNFKDSLYKDLRDINNKLKNKEDFLKRNYYNLQYQRHFGDEKTCHVCQEMRKKGIISEKEKGLHSALSFRNLRHLKKRSLSKLRISIQPKGKENNNFFSTNNIEAEFKNKYLQFNGLNRPNKLNRFGSSINLTNGKFENNKKKRNFRTMKYNIDKEMEKNRDDEVKRQYGTLKQYFNS